MAESTPKSVLDDEWTDVNTRRHSAGQGKRSKAAAPPDWLINMTVPKGIQTTTGAPFFLLLMGLPGSGKSVLATQLSNAMPQKFVRVNQDDLKSRKACIKAATRAFRDGKCPIVDRCHAGPDQRKAFLKLARELKCPVDLLILDVPQHVCLLRCKSRRDHPTVQPHEAPKVMGFMKHDWQLPDKQNERFRRVWHVIISEKQTERMKELQDIVFRELLPS